MDLFPQIAIPRDHTAPYHNPRTGLEALFFTVGPFASTDMLFPGTAGDLDLFTDKEVYALSRIGALKSPITITSNPHISIPASRMEPDSSTRKCSQRDSLRHRHPVSSAAGSVEDLDKSEYECSTEPKRITGTDMAWLPSMAYWLTGGFPVSVLAQKSDRLREIGLTNAGTQPRQSVHNPLHFYYLQRL